MAAESEEKTQPEEESQGTMEFEFSVPEGEAGATWEIKAPDGVMLHIKRPQTVLTGDRICMCRDDDGKWGIKYVVRPEACSTVGMNGQVQKRNEAELKEDLGDTRIVCNIQLDTTKGPIDIKIVPTWSPLGAQRFIQLVVDNVFTDMAFYRAVPRFLVQFGVRQDQKELEVKYPAINDDPLRGVPVKAGSVCFSASGANTRQFAICIFLEDIEQLGQNPWETPIGKVTDETLATLKNIYTGYGDMPQCGGSGPDPTLLEEKGNDYIKTNFPKCDFVKKAIWVTG